MKLDPDLSLGRIAMLSLLVAPGNAEAAISSLVPQSPLPPAPPSIPVAAPRVDLWQQGAPTTSFGSGIHRDVQCRTLDRIVSLEWRFATPALPSSANVKAQNSEVFATQYWPTYVVPADSYCLSVAGKTADGDAVLERWTFEHQSAQGTPAPSCTTAGSAGAGAPRYAWTLPPRSHVEEIVRIPAGAPEGLIRAVLPNLQSPTRSFLFLDGSRELWSVDLVAKTHDCAASPVTTPGAITATELTKAYQSYWGEDYTQRGYCYFFVATDLPSSGPMAATLVFSDSNRDGRLDSVRTISKDEWVLEGWGDPANLAQPHR